MDFSKQVVSDKWILRLWHTSASCRKIARIILDAVLRQWFYCQDGDCQVQSGKRLVKNSRFNFPKRLRVFIPIGDE